MSQQSRISVTRIFLVCILLISIACLPVIAADAAADSLAISNTTEEAADNDTVSEPIVTETATVTGTATVLPAETESGETAAPAEPVTNIPATEVPDVATTVTITEVPVKSPAVNAAEPPTALPVQTPVTATLTQSTATVTAGESSGIPALIRLPMRAEFRGYIRAGWTPLSVHFIDESDGSPNSWAWDFGDGQTSTDKNPVHIYEKAGKYTVNLTASNHYGNTDTVTRPNYVTVLVPSNVWVFGNHARITSPPAHMNYTHLGGTSAITRDGSLETFIAAPVLDGTDWVQVTNGAATKSDGTLVVWTPGSTADAWSFSPAATGKRYVAITQSCDWLLTIYLDNSNVSHLEMMGNAADHPDVFSTMPASTGWKAISAGNEHAFAIRDDNTYVGWGRNTDHQLDLPANVRYVDLAAGKDFSLGMSVDGTIYAAGKDDAGQVSGIPKGSGYMAIEAGTETGAALRRDGVVKVWGRQLAGTDQLAGPYYSDISLVQDTLFVLREPGGKEVIATEPLSPNKPTHTVDGTLVDIPFGSSFEHTHNDVTRVLDPDGHEILWASDEAATQVRFPSGAVYPVSVIHSIPSGSTVDGTKPYLATVTNPNVAGGSGVVMTVSEDKWYDESSSSQIQTFPRAVCFAGKGCSIGVAAKQQLFLSETLPGSASAVANGSYIPGFSIRQLANESWVGILSALTPDGAVTSAEPVSLGMMKYNVDPDQAINFSIISGKWGNESGTNVVLSAKANLTSENAVLQYSGVATASQQLASMTLTPRIWKKGTAGDILVYTGESQSCMNTKECRLTGTFIPVWDISNVTATYFANVTTLYSLPTEITAANPDIPGQYATIYPTGVNEPVPEVLVTEPLVPQKPGAANNPEGTAIPWNSTVEHALKDGEPVTAIISPDGQPVSWTKDKDSAKIGVPGNRQLPVTSVFIVPSESMVNQTMFQNLVVTDPTSLDPAISVKTHYLSAGSTDSFVSGVHYPKKGGTVATVSGDNVFMAPLVQSSTAQFETDSSYKYMQRYFGNEEEISILCDGTGDAFKCTGSFNREADSVRAPVSVPKKLRFTLMPSEMSGNQQLEIGAEAIALKTGRVISYTFSTTSSQILPQINITPTIFSNNMENRSIVYRGADRICYNTDHCTVSGTYPIIGEGDYFAHGYINFTVPDSYTAPRSSKNLYLLPDSDIISLEQPSSVAGDSVSIKQIDNKDIYLWGLVSERQDRNKTGKTSWVNTVLYNKNRYVFLEDLKTKSGSIWHHGAASGGNGYSGQKESEMSWKTVTWGDNDHLEKGAFLNDKAAGGRYHCPLFPGGYSSSLKNEWTFANCHHEYWVWGTPTDAYLDSTHVVYTKDDEGNTVGGYDKGRSEFYNDLVTYNLINSGYSEVDFNDAETYYNYHDGKTWVLTGK